MTFAKWLVCVAGLAIAVRAQAQESPEIRQVAHPTEVVAGEGAFLPQTLSARVGSTQAFALGSGGYDSSRGGPLIDSAAEASVWGPLALRVQATYSNDTKKMRRSVGGRAQLLRQERHGIDGAVLALGLDTRARFAIGTQHGRAATTEPSFDFLAGPVATVLTGPVALFAESGPSVFRLSGGSTRAGAAALAGVGAAF